MIFSTQSTHKLLAGLSQASQILVQESSQQKLDRDVFNEAFLMHMSTSPQYAIIASCDVAAAMMEPPGGNALVEESILELAANHPTVAAIERGEAVSDEQLLALERTMRQELGRPGLELSEGNIRKAFARQVGSLMEFLRELLELEGIPDYAEIVRRQFEAYIAGHTEFNADQVRFLRAVQSVFLHKRRLALPDLYDFGGDPKTIQGFLNHLCPMTYVSIPVGICRCCLQQVQGRKHAIRRAFPALLGRRRPGCFLLARLRSGSGRCGRRRSQADELVGHRPLLPLHLVVSGPAPYPSAGPLTTNRLRCAAGGRAWRGRPRP